jgi:hypothetical protein
MNVVCNPADASGRDTVLFGNSAQEWPEPFPRLRVQHRGTLFGAENIMNIERAKGVGHGPFIFWHFEC